MKRALEAFGLTVAKTYLGSLVIFVGGLLWLLAYVLDHVGLSQPLGAAGLIGYLVFCFVAALFFLVYAWPHVSPVVGKVLDQLGDASKS
jgi:hypothetical protein